MSSVNEGSEKQRRHSSLPPNFLLTTKTMAPSGPAEPKAATVAVAVDSSAVRGSTSGANSSTISPASLRRSSAGAKRPVHRSGSLPSNASTIPGPHSHKTREATLVELMSQESGAQGLSRHKTGLERFRRRVSANLETDPSLAKALADVRSNMGNFLARTDSAIAEETVCHDNVEKKRGGGDKEGTLSSPRNAGDGDGGGGGGGGGTGPQSKRGSRPSSRRRSKQAAARQRELEELKAQVTRAEKKQQQVLLQRLRTNSGGGGGSHDGGGGSNTLPPSLLDANDMLKDAEASMLDSADIMPATRFEILAGVAQRARRTGNYKYAVLYYQKALDVHVSASADEAASSANTGEARDSPTSTSTSQSSAVAVASVHAVRINMGLAFENLGQWQAAHDCYAEALHSCRVRNDLEGMAGTHSHLGCLWEQRADLEHARRHHGQALLLHRERGADRLTLAMALSNLGCTCSLAASHEDALRFHKQALALCSSDPVITAGQAIACSHIGGAYAALGDWERAMTYYLRDEELSRQNKNVPGQIDAQRQRAGLLFSFGQADEAQQLYTKALELLEAATGVRALELGDAAQLSVALAKGSVPSSLTTLLALLQDLAILHVSRCEWPQAYVHYKRMLAVCKWYPPLQLDEASICMRVGWVCMATVDLKESLTHFQRALDLYERHGEHSGQALALCHIGHTYSELGEYSKAAIRHEQAYHLYRDFLNDREGQARCYSNLGHAFYCAGAYKKALMSHTKYLTICQEELEDSAAGEAEARHSLGLVHIALDDKESAAEQLETCLMLCAGNDLPLQEASALVDLGELRASMGEYATAIESLRTAVAIFAKEASDTVGEVRALAALGQLHMELGLADASLSCHERILSMCAADGVAGTDAELDASLGVARAKHMLNDYAGCIFHLNWALTLAKQRAPADWASARASVRRAHAGRLWPLACDMGTALLTLHEPERAIPHLQTAVIVLLGRAPESEWIPIDGQQVRNMVSEDQRQYGDGGSSKAKVAASTPSTAAAVRADIGATTTPTNDATAAAAAAVTNAGVAATSASGSVGGDTVAIPATARAVIRGSEALAHALSLLGKALLATNRVEEARACHELAHTAFEMLGDTCMVMRACRHLYHVHLALGEQEKAFIWYDRSQKQPELYGPKAKATDSELAGINEGDE